jgi:hypothetical protein
MTLRLEIGNDRGGLAVCELDPRVWFGIQTNGLGIIHPALGRGIFESSGAAAYIFQEC